MMIPQIGILLGLKGAASRRKQAAGKTSVGRDIVQRALAGNILTDQEREAFDEWKFDHSSDDILDLLSEIGNER